MLEGKSLGQDIMINGNDGGVYKTLNVFKDTVDWISLNNVKLVHHF